MDGTPAHRRRVAWTAVAAGITVALAVIDAATGVGLAITSSLIAGPLVAALRAGALPTALVGALAVALALLTGVPNDIFGTGDHLARCLVVLVGSGLAVLLAVARERAQAAQHWNAFMGETTSVLSASLDLDVAAHRLAELCVAELADWCIVDLALPDGSMRRVAVAHADPAARERAAPIAARPPVDPSLRVGTVAAMRTGAPQLLARVDEATLREVAQDEEHLAHLRALRPVSAMAFPLRAHGRTLGAMLFISSREDRIYTERDVERVGELVDRAALVADNARLFTELAAAGAELRRSRDQLEAILQNVADAITVQDSSGRVVYANDAAVRSLGARSPEGVVGTEPADILAAFEVLDDDGAPFDLDRLPGRVALGGGTPEPVTVRLRDRATGEERWSVVKATSIRDDTGAVALAITIIEDVTAQKETELAQRLLAQASQALAASLDHETTLGAVARLAVPTFADWCVVDMPDPLGRLVAVAVAARSDEHVALVHEMRRRHPPRPDDRGGVWETIRTGRSQLYADVTDDLLQREAADAGHLRVLREVGLRSAIVVPIAARGRTLGAISFVTGATGRRYDADDLALAEELGRRAGIAVDNARLYSERSYVAQALQQSLLPPHLPEIPGLDVAARFRPAGAAIEVGGDFYDLFATGGGWTAVMGDVCGKGPDAAAITALARYTVRAAAMSEESPSAILRVVNEAMMRQRSDERFLTLALARLELDGPPRVTAASGGHPLPIVVRREGRVETLGRPGTLLGILPDLDVADDALELAPGDALVLYTDGVTDADAPAHTVAFEDVTRALREVAGRSADMIAGRLEEAALAGLEGEPRDDIAILVARVGG